MLLYHYAKKDRRRTAFLAASQRIDRIRELNVVARNAGRPIVAVYRETADETRVWAAELGVVVLRARRRRGGKRIVNPLECIQDYGDLDHIDDLIRR